jgi:glucose/arabinose dehydrogenase
MKKLRGKAVLSVALGTAIALTVGVSANAGVATAPVGPRPMDLANGPVEPVGSPTVIATGLKLPWSMTRLNSGSVFVSERDTALIKEIEPDGTVRTVRTVPNVRPAGEGGLLGITLSPAHKYIYAYTTTSTDNRVVRMSLTGRGPGNYKLGTPTTVFSGIKKGTIHNGGRIKFGPDGYLYITAGDTGTRTYAQSLTTKAGKIFRVTSTGRVPAGNPFPHSPVWSLGHRNPQGITWDGSGTMWESELGQDTWDELNIIVKGKNYGWPNVEGIAHNAKYKDPIYQWQPSEASPSGLLWSHGTLFMAALRGQRLWVMQPSGSTVTATAYFTGTYGRIRDVINGPNNTILVATSNGTDRILQFTLAPVAP